ncbi:unnamed protein product [Onchocerca ochengi]|uniref:UBC core domain-containing protein n=1 Tax=Onchocerca ochengi TaxID=42157 RepID=A0A182ELW9_ONCOC|nr:unnamed protein product [Onchocerca ochengi]
MARLATEGASERDAMLKKGIEGISSDKKAGNVAKWQKNSDDNEREMRQQMSTSETKAKKRANAEEKKPRVANSAGKSPTSSHQSDIEHEQNLRENKKYSIKKSITVFLKFIYHDGYVCNRTICSWLAAGIYVMLHTTQDAPVYYGETTFIGGVPGIGFEPRKRSMKKEQNIFKWNIDDPTSYAFYVGRLRRILYEILALDTILVRCALCYV